MGSYGFPSSNRSNPWDNWGSTWDTPAAAPTGGTSGSYGTAGTGLTSDLDQWNNIVTQTSSKYGVPADVLRGIMWVESRGNAKAYNKTPNGGYGNATGLMQIMSGLGDGRDLYDPSVSLDIAGKMLQSHYKQYGSWDSAIQRYNGTLGKPAGQKYLSLVNAARQKYGGIGAGGQNTQSSSGSLASAINYAKGQVGYDTYQNGVQMNLNDPKPKVTDCSGLVQWSYNKAGIKLPRTAYLQYNATQRINRQDLKPGDLIFFQNTYNATGQKGNTQNISHVGIYVGNGQMVNSTGSQGNGTVLQSIDTPFWKQHLAGFGRVNGQNAGAAAPEQAAAAPQKSDWFNGVVEGMRFSPFAQQNSDIYNTGW